MNKSLRRCDEPYLDNLLKTLNSISEICLPSILDALLQWYEQQIKQRSGAVGYAKLIILGQYKLYL